MAGVWGRSPHICDGNRARWAVKPLFFYVCYIIKTTYLGIVEPPSAPKQHILQIDSVVNPHHIEEIEKGSL